MNETPQHAEWPTWWSWPWNMISALTNPPVSASPPVSLAPQTLSQAILPGWLFANTVNVTEENSSSPETERQIVAAHSYGQQLGRILDVVNELIAERPAGAPDVQSIRDFENLWHDIEKIKLQPAVRRIEQAITDLAEVKQQDSGEYQRLAAGLRSILEDQSGADSEESSHRLLGQARVRTEGRTPHPGRRPGLWAPRSHGPRGHSAPPNFPARNYGRARPTG